MTIVLSSAQISKTAGDDDHAEVFVHVHAHIVAAVKVRRKINGWLCLEVGDRMLAGEPELIVGEKLIWRVPVKWTSPIKGVLIQDVSQIMVDAVTGEIISSQETVQEIQQRVAAFAHSLRTATS